MRKLVYHLATSLDGFMARSDDAFDCFINEGPHVSDYVLSLKSDYDSVVMGRRTYDVGLKFGVTNPYPWLKTYVVSRSLSKTIDPNVTVLADDAVAAVRALKEEEGKPIYFAGGGELAKQLFADGLIDEVIVKLNPFLMARGIPMLPGEEQNVRLSLQSTKVYRNSVVLLQYDVLR